LIRNPGELRLSNFSSWPAAYSDFIFTYSSGPDFDKAELEKALQSFATVNDGFGGRLSMTEPAAPHPVKPNETANRIMWACF